MSKDCNQSNYKIVNLKMKKEELNIRFQVLILKHPDNMVMVSTHFKSLTYHTQMLIHYLHAIYLYYLVCVAKNGDKGSN